MGDRVVDLAAEGGRFVRIGPDLDREPDKVLAFVAPVLVGGPGPRPVGGAGVETLAGAWRLTRTVVRQMEQDVMIEGYLVPPPWDPETGSGRAGEGRAQCSPAS